MRLIIFAFLLFIIVISGCQKNEKELFIKDDEVGLIGYGSLTSIESMEETLGRKYEGFFDVVELNDYKRNWKVFMPNKNDLYPAYFKIQNGDTIFPINIMYLNIDSSPNSSLNGCLFVVKKSELADFDEREWIYKRIDVTDNIEGLDIKNGKVYAYTALDKYKVPSPVDSNLFAVRKTYLDIIDSAFNHLNKDYKDRFFQTTEPFEKNLVIEDLYIE